MVLSLPRFVIGETPCHAHQAQEEEEDSDEKCSTAKVEVTNIHGLQNVDPAGQGIDQRERKEEVGDLPGVKVSVVGEDVEDVTDSKPAADGGIEAKDKEEFLVPSTDAVSEEEAVMVQNVNASLTVGAVVGPEGDVEVAGETFLVPAIEDSVASRGIRCYLCSIFS